jgi:hypothetical protein
MENPGNWLDFLLTKHEEKFKFSTTSREICGEVQFLYDLSAAKSSGITGNYLRFFLRENLN